MGHTFCAAPASASSPSNSNANSNLNSNAHPNSDAHPKPSDKAKAKPTPRSPGVPGNWATWGHAVPDTDSRNLKKICELHEDSRYLRTLREILSHSPPPPPDCEAGKQKRKRSGKLKRMLSGRVPQEVVSGAVALRVSSGGKRYAQITAGSGNPSVYRVNECVESGKRRSVLGKGKGEEGGKEEDAMGGEVKGEVEGRLTEPFLAPIATVDGNESYYLGITDDYLLPAVDAEEQGHDRPESLLPLPPALGNEGVVKMGEVGSNTFPRLVFKSQAAQGQIESGASSKALNDRGDGSQVKRSSLRVVKRPPTARSRPLSPEAGARFPPSSSRTFQAYAPQTPRSSVEEIKRGTAVSPKANSRARAPSLQSANESVVEDGQSEASVGTPMMARSAEVVRAGYSNGDVHRFPKPGPAPTGALPSLPEGLDSVVMLPSVGPAPATPLPSPEPSPKRASPARKYWYRPLDDIVSEDTAKLLRMQTKSGPKRQVVEPLNVDQTRRPSLDKPGGSTATPPITTPMQQMTMRADLQEKRAESRRELKLRDLNRLRSQTGQGDMAQATAGRAVADEIGQARTTPVPDIKESSSSPVLLVSSQPEVQPNPGLIAAEVQRKPLPRPLSALSPIVVVAEQEPTAIIQPIRASGKPNGNSKRSSKKHHCRKDSFTPPTTNSPSFPSSDEESIYRSQRSRIREPQRHSHTQTASTHRSSVLVQDLEAKLEARIAELERKNALLLNAFVAVINTSAGYAQSPLMNGERFSGLSVRTSSGVSGQRSSNQSGHRDGHLNGISEMYAPLSEGMESGVEMGKTNGQGGS